MWLAAVLSYGREFGTGVRHTERVDLTKLTPEERRAHEYFIDLRNKHVAHSVNSLEQVVTLAYLTDSAFARRAITRVGQTHVSVNPMTEEQAEALRTLSSTFIRQLNLRVRELHEAIGAELLELDLDAVYALPEVGVTMPTQDDVTKNRRKR